MFSREARLDAKKVLVVISDQTSDSEDNEIAKAVKPLQDNDVIVIPVALGDEADKAQLVKLIDDPSTLVTADTSNNTNDIKEEIMKQVFEGICTEIHYSKNIGNYCLFLIYFLRRRVQR